MNGGQKLWLLVGGGEVAPVQEAEVEGEEEAAQHQPEAAAGDGGQGGQQRGHQRRIARHREVGRQRGGWGHGGEQVAGQLHHGAEAEQREGGEAVAQQLREERRGGEGEAEAGERGEVGGEAGQVQQQRQQGDSGQQRQRGHRDQGGQGRLRGGEHYQQSIKPG